MTRDVPILLLRRLSQYVVLLGFIAIPFLNKAEINVLSGNLLAFNLAGVPLGDPLAALQVLAGTGSATRAMLVGAGLVLLLAFLLGPVFCAWICPYGLLSELVHGIRGKGAARADADEAGPTRKGGPSASPFWVRLGIAAAGLVLVFAVLPVPVLNQLSMPGWYTRAAQQGVLYGHVLVGAVAMLGGMLVIEALAGSRIWCRYLCPQSVLISLAAMLLPARLGVRFAPKKCTCQASDRVCLKACSLQLNPRKPLAAAQRLQCTNCGDCVQACRARGRALALAFGKKKPTGS